MKENEPRIDPIDGCVARVSFSSLIAHSPLCPEMSFRGLTDVVIFESEGLLEVEEKSFNLDVDESPGAANSRTFYSPFSFRSRHLVTKLQKDQI